MKNLPIGIQTFSELIQEGYIYIDKTRQIHKLFSDGGKYYFISRPRRFGKSLLLSTLKEIFSGNKELFDGLWIYDKIDWEPHPVIHIDFLGLNYKTPQRLEETLERLIEDIATSYGIDLDPKRYCNEKFKELIVKLSDRGRVVVLIDEYDKPIIDKVEDPELALANRDILREFYGVIKTADKNIKFALITGVSKFSRVSVFSGLNNLRDITLSSQFSTLLGYTEEELLHYFGDRIRLIAGDDDKISAPLVQKIKAWYDGYSWDGEHFVFNPFSILNFFIENQFDNYWFSSGTPTFLTRLIRKSNSDIKEFDNLSVSAYFFDSYDIDHIEITSLLFQTGYLTIKSKVNQDGSLRYNLSYPNEEVRNSFLNYLFREYIQKDFAAGIKIIDQMTSAIRNDEIERFLDSLKWLFASIPYNIFPADRESCFHSIIYLVLKLIGISVSVEVETNIGRIDAVVESAHSFFIFEFKMGKPEDVLEQIKDRKYYEGFLGSQKNITLIGIGFSTVERNLSGYKIETIQLSE